MVLTCHPGMGGRFGAGEVENEKIRFFMKFPKVIDGTVGRRWQGPVSDYGPRRGCVLKMHVYRLVRSLEAEMLVYEIKKSNI